MSRGKRVKSSAGATEDNLDYILQKLIFDLPRCVVPPVVPNVTRSCSVFMESCDNRLTPTIFGTYRLNHYPQNAQVLTPGRGRERPPPTLPEAFAVTPKQGTLEEVIQK